MNFHGTDDQLEAYALGRLPEAELTALEEHMMVCGECRDRLHTTEAFAAGMKEALKQAPVPARPLWSAWLHRPAVYMTVGLLALIALLSIFSNGRVKYAPVSSLTLMANRGAMPKAAPARQLDLTLVDAGQATGVFRVEVVDSMGQTVWSGLAQASVSGILIRVQRELVPGDYFVRLRGDSGEVTREYGFRVQA